MGTVKLKPVRERVKNLLEKKPHLRDDDQKLIANIWYQDNENKIFAGTADQLLRALADGKLTNFESIRRVRQKLQEQHPSLRGTKYKDRQDHQGTVVKEIRKFNTPSFTQPNTLFA